MDEIIGSILDVLAAIFIIAAAGTALFAGLGMARLPDMLSRTHAATKPQVLGVLFMLLALACAIRSWSLLPLLLLLWLFQMITIPVGSHVLSRAGYRTGKVARESIVLDELDEVIEKELAKDRAEADKKS